MSESDDEAHVVSQSQLHALQNRLTVIKGLSQLLSRQIHRDGVRSADVEHKLGVLLKEISAMESEIADVWRADGDTSHSGDTRMTLGDDFSGGESSPSPSFTQH